MPDNLIGMVDFSNSFILIMVDQEHNTQTQSSGSININTTKAHFHYLITIAHCLPFVRSLCEDDGTDSPATYVFKSQLPGGGEGNHLEKISRFR